MIVICVVIVVGLVIKHIFCKSGHLLKPCEPWEWRKPFRGHRRRWCPEPCAHPCCRGIEQRSDCIEWRQLRHVILLVRN
jgi:hypothetical protein